jgi:hypothetical protein
VIGDQQLARELGLGKLSVGDRATAVAKLGVASVKRIYGDSTSSNTTHRTTAAGHTSAQSARTSKAILVRKPAK